MYTSQATRVRLVKNLNLNSSRVRVSQLTSIRDRARVACRVEFEYHNTRLKLLISLIKLYYLINRVETILGETTVYILYLQL